MMSYNRMRGESGWLLPSCTVYRLLPTLSKGFPRPVTASHDRRCGCLRKARGDHRLHKGSDHGCNRWARQGAGTGAHHAGRNALLHGRSTERLATTERELALATHGVAQSYRADFASLSEVRRLAHDVVRDPPRL